MLNSDENENKPIGKVSQRKSKSGAKSESGKKAEAGKKAEPRKRKDAQPAPKPDQLLEALQRLTQVEEPIVEPSAEPAAAPAMSVEISVTETPTPDLAETSPAAVAEAAEIPIEPAAPVQATAVNLQTIANAYGDYSKKSFEQTSTFVAKLVGARSLDKAIELQTAFAREAYETFMEQSRRIRELHRELAKQRLTRLEGFVGMTRGR